MSDSPFTPDFYDDMYERDRQEAEQDHADRWLNAWDRLEALGVVGPDDRSLTLAELERIAAYAPGADS